MEESSHVGRRGIASGWRRVVRSVLPTVHTHLGCSLKQSTSSDLVGPRNCIERTSDGQNAVVHSMDDLADPSLVVVASAVSSEATEINR